MKKLMTVAAAALCAAVGFGADAIESANTVGFIKSAVLEKNSYTAMGVQFKVTGEAGSETPINNLLTVDVLRTGTKLGTSVDQIQIWDDESGLFKAYYYNKDLSGWCSEDDSTKITTDTVKAGQGIFFRRANYKDGSAVTMSGEVFTGDSVTYADLEKNSYTFMCYPWPVDFKIADMEKCITVAPRSGTKLGTSVDQVLVWNDESGLFEAYYLKKEVGFVKDGEDDVTKDVIPAGTCFFFRRANYKDAGTVVFTKPAGL